MVVEMLAGDEIAPDDPATLRATGFLVRNWDIFNRNAWLANTVEHTARAFLGVTIQCARCHDHKFDPISQADYYRFRAFFEPHQIRIDRVPGQPDRTKAGLPRAFDDFLETPTFLFVRGDEASPDKTGRCTPAIPPSSAARAQDRTRRAARAPPVLPTGRSASFSRRAVRPCRAEGRARRGRRTAVCQAAERRRPRKVAAGRQATLPTRTPQIARSALDLARGEEVGPEGGPRRRGLKTRGRRRGSEAGRRGPRLTPPAPGGISKPDATADCASRDLSRARRQLDGLLAAGAGTEGRTAQAARAKAAADSSRPAPAGRRGADAGQGRGGAQDAADHGRTRPARSNSPRQDDLPRHAEQAPYPEGQHRPTPRPGPLDRRPPEPADGARRGQPRLGAGISASRWSRRRTTSACERPGPNTTPCSTGWPSSSWNRAGASSICTG